MDHCHRLKRPAHAFTLVEIAVVTVMLCLVSSVIYQLFSGTFSQFFKNQTKMNNLRAASVILEYLKHDLRRAVIPTSTAQEPVLPTSSDATLSFFLLHENTVRKVTYAYDGRMIHRSVEGAQDRAISATNVASFSVVVGQTGTAKFLQVAIMADEEGDKDSRSGSSKGNRVTMSAILFPRFFAGAANKEEEYWTEARKL